MALLQRLHNSADLLLEFHLTQEAVLDALLFLGSDRAFAKSGALHAVVSALLGHLKHRQDALHLFIHVHRVHVNF